MKMLLRTLLHKHIFRRHSLIVVALLFFSGLTSSESPAQVVPPPLVTTDAKLPAYDVISIKPNNTGSAHIAIDWGYDHFNASNISLKTLLNNAYSLKEGQLIGLPKWADTSRFDIATKILDPDKRVLEALTDKQSNAMLQPILTDRFQLRFHYEPRILPVYELIVIKGGPKFQDSTITGDQKATNGLGPGNMHVTKNTFASTAVPIAVLVNLLSSQMHRIVVDKTLLNGKYDLDLAWSSDDGQTPAPDSNVPSILTALQEQLGLRLQPAKASVDTFVIDHVELPSKN